MKNLNKQMDELEAKWKRAVADYRNLERRGKSQRPGLVKVAKLESI